MADSDAEEAVMPESLLKREHVLAALTADRGHTAHLKSWSMRQFTEAGENATAFVACVIVEFSQNGKIEKTNYIAKLNPLRGETWSDFMHMAFHKESKLYQEIEPMLTMLLEKRGLDALRIPRCLFSSLEPDQEVIILDDLRGQGFRKYDRRKTMDIAHATVVLQEMARFHAASMLQVTQIPDFEVKYDFLCKHWCNYKADAGDTYRVVMSDNLENVRVLLQTEEGYERAADWVERLKPQVLSMFEEQTATTASFTVICHLDLVNNNLLFRYNERGEPIDVRILDFQMCYIASLATDLAEFFYTCLGASDRKTHLDCLLSTYYASFSEVLEASGTAMPFTYKELHEEYKCKFLFGVLAAIWKLPFIIAEGDEIPDMDNYVDQEAFCQTQQRNMLTMLKKYKNFHLRFLSIFDEVCDLTGQV
ncbi:uncharacterized protein [Procambarus clarkii]|nr:uncharacterized protein LOC123749556 isoform X2 [Procambarus clarkii]